MEQYVTVVSVEDQPSTTTTTNATTSSGSSGQDDIQVLGVGPAEATAPVAAIDGTDSQFVTVLSINHGQAVEGTEPEMVLVYRLPGERLGFGLKFQGGTKNNEKIQRLFIQSCAENSPASRVQASWGFLREGDEILEIDGVSVTQMTRIECVKCLKESNLAIKLLVRNGEGKVQNFYDGDGDVPEKKNGPPPPPPVPPRKLNKRKVVEQSPQQQVEQPPAKQIVEIVHPPDAEVYSNLFSDDISDLISESDDTASTISTVIDKYSICSSLSSEDYTISSNPSSLELAKALKPFTMLEKEFNLEDKLENTLFAFPPNTLNVVQLEVEAEPPSTSFINEYENVTITKVVDENKNYENVIVHASDHQPANYENVTIQAVLPDSPTLSQPYENVIITTESDNPDSTVYENVDLKAPPQPLPRQAVVEPMKRSAAPIPVSTLVIPPPRQKSPKGTPAPPIPKHTSQLPHEFNTIQSWLQEATEVIHECALADSPKDDKALVATRNGTGSNENLPRLIDFHPKISSPLRSPMPTTVIAVEDDEPLDQPVVVKKCIKITATEISGNNGHHNYIESSSSDEDEEKSYEPGEQLDDDDIENGLQRSYTVNDDEDDDDGVGAFDAYSDEDGEKLGPPEIVAGGPSEAYFNFHWTTTLLPPIGEVEEEFSSLENQQSGPIVIIDTAEETLINDSNNNQHRELKSKLNGHHSPHHQQFHHLQPAPMPVRTESTVTIAEQEDSIPPTTIIINGSASEQQDGTTGPADKTATKTAAADNDAYDAIEQVNNIELVEVASTAGDEGVAAAAEAALDQLTNDLGADNGFHEYEDVAQMEEVRESVNLDESKVVEAKDVKSKVVESKDDTEVDVDLLAVVGDSVDSDFEELVKAQLDEDHSEQMQQIHERIIVGIERSGDTADRVSEEVVKEDASETKSEDKDYEEVLRPEDVPVKEECEQFSEAVEMLPSPEGVPLVDAPDGQTEDPEPADETQLESNQESANSSQAAALTGASTNGSSTTSATSTNNTSEVGPEAAASTSMDQMNNVVTTTTTVTAIASTVHQQTTSPGQKVAPPAFSRLPPDGHEFPPNFSEPAGMIAIINGASTIPGAKGEKHSSYDDIPDLPKSHPPPVPRKVFRQDLVLKQFDQNVQSAAVENSNNTFKKPPIFPSPVRSNSLVAQSTEAVTTKNDDARRRSFDIHEINKPPSRVTLVGSNWRKDEKSERSVRDKIAMFSNGSGAGGGGGGGGGTDTEGLPPVLRKFSKDFTKSSENLLSSDSGYSKKSSVDPIETYATLRKKAHSVENLDEVDSIQNGVESGSFKSKFSLETSKPVVLGKAFSVENLNPSNGIKATNGDGKLDNGGLFGNVKNLARTTSFSGYSNGNSLATINTNVEERRKSSITNLLEQRKKSMSKLRGLVIPEKVPETEVLPDSKIIGLPIIKSKDSEKILSSNVLNKIPENSYARKTATLPTPSKSNGNSFHPTVAPKPSPELGGTYKSIFRNLNGASSSSSQKSEPKPIELDEQNFRRPLSLVPPAKPPRTSLVYPPPKGLDQRSQTTEDESDDSDSVLSSRVSSPPVSPVAPSSPEKYVLTRTLSSETNTSIASSNSTLTSSSGSQASCSSVGSTPAIDMSRRISKSSSSEMSMNRKNVLASAKSRSGRGDLKIEDAANGKVKRYEDGDSTDGYEEEERRKSKSKPRNSLTNGKSANNGFEEKELIHYKVVDTTDSIVDKVIKVASYVEVVSDVEETASVESEAVVPMQKPVEPVKEKISFSATKSMSVDSGSANTMSDLAKWVRHEAAKTIVSKESEPAVRPDVKKFTRTISEQITRSSEETQVPAKRELRSSVDTKKLNLAEIRKNFEAKSNNSTVIPSPVKIIPKEAPVSVAPAKSTPVAVTNNHDRFSSWDSLASSSSGVSSLQTNSLLGNAVANCSGSSQTLQSTPSDYGSFSSLGSSHSLITPQDLQLIIEEADPPLATPEAFVIVLQRETPESSIGITLAGGSDYEAKEITIHKILSNSPAERDARLRRGDRILSINGLSMRGLTHRESLSVLKTPRPEVVMVITRSKSLVIDNSTLSKTKRPSLGSLSSLAEKNELPDYERKIKIQHKASRSLDLDLDIVSNEAESVFDGTASEDGLLSADESKCSSITPASDEIASPIMGSRVVEILKDGAGLGFSIEGGFDSPAGNKPLLIKKIFMGGAAEKSGLLRAGEEIVAINDISIERMTRIQVWNMMKKLPNGGVNITLK